MRSRRFLGFSLVLISTAALAPLAAVSCGSSGTGGHGTTGGSGGTGAHDGGTTTGTLGTGGAGGTGGSTFLDQSLLGGAPRGRPCCGDGGICAGNVCCAASLACGAACCATGSVCSFQACVVPGATCTDSRDYQRERVLRVLPGRQRRGRGSRLDASAARAARRSLNGKCLPSPPTLARRTPARPTATARSTAWSSAPSTRPAPFNPALKASWGERAHVALQHRRDDGADRHRSSRTPTATAR